MVKKLLIIKYIVPVILLACLILLFFRQDTLLRLQLSGETIIRNGQTLTVSLYTDTGDMFTLQAQTPYYSIYEYQVRIPSGIWSGLSDIGFEFGGVRRDDRIYIESLSVTHPVSGKKSFTGSNMPDNMTDITDPYFTIPAEAIKLSAAINPVFIISISAFLILWVLAIFVVPRSIYKKLLENLHRFIDSLKQMSVMDVSIALFGALGFVFYYYGNKISPGKYENIAYHILFAGTVFFLLIKLLAGKNTEALLPDNPDESKSPVWLPYLVLTAISALVYIPALFPNPYYHNDEYQVVEGAEWFLSHGNFENYDRAWPHTLLVSTALKIFGPSTVSLRSVSAVCGIIFIVSAYHIIRKLSKRSDITYLSVAILLCNPQLIGIFTTIRMYSLMMPLSVWLIYCIYLTLHSESSFKRDNAVIRFIKTHFDFNCKYALAVIILTSLCLLVHSNTAVLLLSALIYIFILAFISKKRKYINLSITGTVLIFIIAAAFYINQAYQIRIPVITEIAHITLSFAAPGVSNYDYFWKGIEIPLGPYTGLLFLLTAAFYGCRGLSGSLSHAAIPTGNKNILLLLYFIICYITTVVILVFFMDRYYTYAYMSFLAPVTAMLISAGAVIITDKAGASAKQAVCLFISVAAVLQFTSSFKEQYVDSSGRTKFDRPYSIIINDAKVEGLDIIPLYATFERRYFYELVENGRRVGKIRLDVDDSGNMYRRRYQIDEFIRDLREEDSVVYFFSEREKMFHVLGEFRMLLDYAADFITDIDNSVIYKFHFIDSSPVAGDSSDAAGNIVLSVTDEFWEDDVAYLHCKMSFNPLFSGAVFAAVEVIERGTAQSAAHRYQIFVPDDFGTPDAYVLEFILPVRPKTEEYSENIMFDLSGQVYVFYGEDYAVISDIPVN